MRLSVDRDVSPQGCVETHRLLSTALLSVYFTATDFEATPPRLLLAVTFTGLVDTMNWPEYFPPPSFLSVPINASVEVT